MLQDLAMTEINFGPMEPVPPKIPSASIDDFRDPSELYDFWHVIGPWLMQKGVKLCVLGPPDASSYGWPPQERCAPSVSTAASLPFARCIQGNRALCRQFKTRPLACGQDFLGRDIMLRVAQHDSHQYRIFQTLLRQSEIFLDSRTFPCVLPPLAILDTPHDYAVVSMPMWVSPVVITDMRTVREVLRFIECLLQGLEFLHANRIAHRDIWDHNIVVNCYPPDQLSQAERLREDLQQHRDSGDVIYALMDYDQSIQHPADVSLKSFRRPAHEARYGSALYRPDDVCLGAPQYNPFAFDVAMLGNLFRAHFAVAVPAVPALAPLFDAMTTHVLSQRFTAEEARKFYNTEIAKLPLAVLETAVQPCLNWYALDDPEVYWSTLSLELQALWRHFRTPPWPQWKWILNWFIGFPGCCQLIVFTRRVLGI